MVVFAGGALLAPLVHWLAQSLAGEFPKLAHSGFHRYVSRSIEGLAVLGLWPLLRSLGANSWRELGLVSPKGHGKELGGGFALGFVSLAVVAALALACHERVIAAMDQRFAQHLLGAAATAITVAVLEEMLFRGALFGALRKGMSWIAALLISSMIYALVHFMRSPSDHGPVRWYSGWVTLIEMLGGFAEFRALIPGFFTLTVAGVLLGLAYQRTGNLYFSIGLHASWIFWRKSYGILARPVADGNEWLWGSGKMFDGWMALVIIAGSFFLFERVTRVKAPSTKIQAPEKLQHSSTKECSDHLSLKKTES
jgi:membrane protease YdiL (CAAX protease family)